MFSFLGKKYYRIFQCSFFHSFLGKHILPVLADCPSSSKIHLRQSLQKGKGGEKVVKKQLASRKEIGLSDMILFCIQHGKDLLLISTFIILTASTEKKKRVFIQTFYLVDELQDDVRPLPKTLVLYGRVPATVGFEPDTGPVRGAESPNL
jgi:hypothetical protein